MKEYSKKSEKIRIMLLVIFLLIIHPISVKATPLIIDSVSSSPNPIKWNDGNITITARVQRIDSDPASVYLSVKSPQTENISPYQVEVIDSQSWKYYFSFNPNQTGEYKYTILGEDTLGETTETNNFYFDSVQYPYIKQIVDNSPVKYDDPNGIISINATIDKWDYNISNVTLIITGPENTNITMTKYSESGNTSYYSSFFNPSQKALYVKGIWSPIYKYKIHAIDDSGNQSYSEERTFVSEAYPPSINDINTTGIVIPLGQTYYLNVTINDQTNYTNTTANINRTWVVLSTPNSTEEHDLYYQNGIYMWNYTPSQEALYTYNIYVSDTEGNLIVSDPILFSTKPLGMDKARVHVEVAPFCCGGMMLLPNERYVLSNQTVIWLSIFSNCGNVPLTEYTNITIRKDTIDENGVINESKLVVIPPNIIDYAIDTEDYVDSLEETFFFMIWYTTGLPLGNYTAETWSYFESNFTEGNSSFFCNGTSNTSVHFEIINAIGEKSKPPILIIREMSPQTSQNIACNETSGENCISNKVRLILLNTGKEYVYNITLNDEASIESCKSSNIVDCKIKKAWCSSYNCTFNYDNSTNQTSYNIEFPSIEFLEPRGYKIIEYSFIPPTNQTVYDQNNPSSILFSATANYTYKGESRTSKENNDKFNPPESRFLYLNRKPAFNYDIQMEGKNETNKRSYNLNTINNMTMSIFPIFTQGYSLNTWYLEMNFTPDISLISCSPVSGPSCSCSIFNLDSNHTTAHIQCSSNSTFTETAIAKIEIKFNSTKSDYFTAPIHSNSTDIIGTYMDELYLPGLFLISNPPQPKPEPEPKPEPQPQPEPEPEPEPEPQPEPKPKIELVLTPINDTYTVEQGQTFPTFFWIENIGNATATNIKIEPKIPGTGWNFSQTLVSELKPGEKVNRTLMFSTSDDIKPGVYVIPVSAIVENETADIAYITIEVKEQKNKAKIMILESPPEVEINPNSNLTIPIYLKNIGKKDLHEITARIENAENCLSIIKSDKIDMNISKEGSLNLFVKSKEGPKECTSLLIISSKENAYAFAPIKLIVKPEPPLIPFKGQLTPIITLVWTLMLIIYTIIRKRKIRKGTARPSKVARLIVYMLLLGELIIFIYIILWLIGIIELI